MKSFVLKRKQKRVYKCTYQECSDVFNSIKERTAHIKDKHSLVRKVCKKCGKKCETVWGYKKHMVIHEQVRGKYECGDCGKTFTHSSYLKRHMKTHIDDGFRFTCVVKECMKVGVGHYKQISDYVRHLEKHKGEVHTCEDCGKQFASEKGVYDHQTRVHRPLLKCKRKQKGCEYSTKDMKLLNKHQAKCMYA